MVPPGMVKCTWCGNPVEADGRLPAGRARRRPRRRLLPPRARGAVGDAGRSLGGGRAARAERDRHHPDMRSLRRRAGGGAPASWCAIAASTASPTGSAAWTTCWSGRKRGEGGSKRFVTPLYCRSFSRGAALLPFESLNPAPDHGQIRNRRRLSALRHRRAGGQQERRAPDPRGVAADRGRARGRQRPAHPRRRVDAGAARGPRRERHAGATITRSSLRASNISSTDVDAELASRIRASFLLAGPLLARTGEARIPPPGGDFIGRRRLDPHLDALQALGAQVAPRHARTRCGRRNGLRGCDFFMDEASVMATENTLMAAALDAGHDDDPQRRIRAARAEPRAPAGEHGRAHRRHRLQRAHGARPQAAGRRATWTSRPTTSRSGASWRSQRSPAGRCASRTPSRTTSR